jgi:uncharacterized protein YkwD
MRKSIIFLFLATLFFTALFFWQNFLVQVPKIEKEIPGLVQKFKENISSPPPLIVEVRLPESFLTQAGVIESTNLQRQKNGLPFLKENQQLNNSALAKAKDMLEKQYFGHLSLENKGPADLAKEAGYEFITIGENLALGDFENDEKLVEGWMASPGHRANILNAQYQEIGVAVLKGKFQGRTTWLAVQHFGKPLASCPQPSEEILAKIKENQNQIEKMYLILSELETEIKAFWPKHGPEYNQKVKEYNLLVDKYNSLIEATKILIEKYNHQVLLFNECAKK